MGRVPPEDFVGGPLAIVKNGDIITVDAKRHTIDIRLSEKEIQQRLTNRKQPKPRYRKGVLYKYMKSVSGASKGAITDL